MSVVAQSSHDLPLGPSTGSDGFKLPPFFHDIPVLIGVALALLLVFLIWAVFLRPRSRRRADLRVASHVLVDSGAEDFSHRRHRRRRRRREHRPRNPTLAETGGLPPPRQTDQLPPSP